MLVADDEDDIRALVALAVRKAGCTVVASVADGAAALDAARTELPDLAVLDVSMPGATGLEVCTALRADPATAGIRILLLSAGASLEDVAAGLAAGADAYLAKPFQVSGLVHQVRSLTRGSRHDHRRGRHRGPRRPAPPPPVAGCGARVRRPPLPGTVLFGVAAVLLATGMLPVLDGELVLAGLGSAFLAALIARLPTAPPRPRDVAFVVPLLQLGAVGLLTAGTASAGVFFLALAPVLALVPGHGRRGVLLAALGTAAALLLPGLLPAAPPRPSRSTAPCSSARSRSGLGGLGLTDSTRRISGQAARIERLEEERDLLLAQVQSRADELDLATRMLAARAQTMTSVIDAVTEQSIIGTDVDGIIRVWNPGAEKMLGLPRPDVVRKRSILEFHLPEELSAATDDGAARPPAWRRSSARRRSTAATSGTGPTWPPTASSAPSRSRSPRAPTTRARTPAGTSSAPT